MTLRRRNALAWIFLSAYALLSAIWAKGLVVCIEADGHVALESAIDACSGCCSSSEEERDTQGETPQVGACPCLDVALGVGNSSAQKIQAPFERALLSLVEPRRASLPSRCTPVFSAHLPRSHASSALTFLRSVVLRV